MLKQKTTWAGLILIGVGVAQVIMGSTGDGITRIVEGFGVIFMRQAVAKIG